MDSPTKVNTFGQKRVSQNIPHLNLKKKIKKPPPQIKIQDSDSEFEFQIQEPEVNKNWKTSSKIEVIS